MTLSGDARWLCELIGENGTGGMSPRLIEAWCSHPGREGLLQELVDSDIVRADEKGRYSLTDKGIQACPREAFYE